MSRHRVELIPPVGENVRFSPRETRHIEKVLRLKLGATIEIFDGLGLSARAILVEHPDGGLAARIEAIAAVESGSRAHLTSICSLIKGERQFDLIEKLTELGVCEIRLFHAVRSVRQIKPELQRRASDHAESAAKQCGRADIPGIGIFDDIRAAITDLQAGTKLIFEPTATCVFGMADVANQAPTSILTGPEGGLAPKEIALATKSGFEIRRLNTPTLRADTAALVCASIVLFAPTVADPGAFQKNARA